MLKKILAKIFVGLIVSLILSNALATTHHPTTSTPHSHKQTTQKNVWKRISHSLKTFKRPQSVWQKIASHMNLKLYAHNELVHQQVRWYLIHSKALYRLTKNAEPYLAYIISELKKRDMPLELALLPMVESSYNPILTSKKGAVGLWQMMPITARDLGISMNWWYDGRRDIVASTHAALDYLQYLHDYFKSWPLTFAAYNSGIGTVQKAIRQNKALGLPTYYRSLDLPQQTKEYVPKIVALAMILSNPQQYHLPIHPVTNRQMFTSVRLNYPLSLTQVATLAHCRLSTVHKLNPGFKRKKPAPGRSHYNVLLPTSRVTTFHTHLKHYLLAANSHKVKTNVYHVQHGDSLISIAHKHHVSLLALRESNHLYSNMIRAGQSLYIPKKQA